VILVGDSTMATRSGYGDALCQLFQPNVICINLARGGRSSGSFRAEGLWDSMMVTLQDSASYRATYVLVQFGHNDQPGKPGRSTDLATEFPVNMARYVDEVKSANAHIVLMTPLTRRMFRSGVLQNDLKPWADATRRVAETKRVPLLDLNAESSAAVAAMGSAEANTFAVEPPPDKSAWAPQAIDNTKAEPNGSAPSKFDHTHLGDKGASFFARMVARELVQAVPAFAVHIRADNPAK
jgi:lysophospholipase L1-like esterase